jgi:hypothetical protein
MNISGKLRYILLGDDDCMKKDALDGVSARKDITRMTGNDPITLSSPEDGGFPRGAQDILKISPSRYKINIPSPDDSHIMVEAVNSSTTVQELEIEIDPDPRQAASIRAKEPKGHYYYRTPEGKWLRKHLEEGSPSRLIIPLEPGVTRIAGVPYFTYSEYVSYVESFDDPRVTREVAFTHENGAFKVYRLTVTNPGGVKDKMKICFGRPSHTNETSGFFMAQGIIEWLLSGDGYANLDNFEWTFYLCPDPKGIYYHYRYEEIRSEIYDTGKNFDESYYDALREGKHHIFLCEHMWNNEHGGIMKGTTTPMLELEAYEYHDPLSQDSVDKLFFPELMPTSQVWKDYVSYWPHWYEYGTDNYIHRDGRMWDWKIPNTLMMNNEIIFYGKDSGGDLIANIKEQGKQWARATEQVYLRFQQRHHYWNASHPMGAVDTTGAVMLPLPEHTLLETMIFLEGEAARKRNADGEPMVIFRKQYEHGLGMKAGGSVTFNIPAGANSFKVNVAMDDACAAAAGLLQFVVKLDGNEVWRSSLLGRYESQMAHIKLPGTGKLTLEAEGAESALADWGGAKFTVNDPDMISG